jgi:hypothetical protein
MTVTSWSRLCHPQLKGRRPGKLALGRQFTQVVAGGAIALR